MSTLFSRKYILSVLAFLLLDLLAVGMGMGVPIFAIGLGFLVGWFVPSVLAALLASAFTFLLMLLIWGPMVRMLFDPAADLAGFGIPMILYEPAASFIGWIVLMVLISPFLQALAAGFTASVRLAWFPPAAALQAG